MVGPNEKMVVQDKFYFYLLLPSRIISNLDLDLQSCSEALLSLFSFSNNCGHFFFTWLRSPKWINNYFFFKNASSCSSTCYLLLSTPSSPSSSDRCWLTHVHLFSLACFMHYLLFQKFIPRSVLVCVPWCQPQLSIAKQLSLCVFVVLAGFM